MNEFKSISKQCTIILDKIYQFDASDKKLSPEYISWMIRKPQHSKRVAKIGFDILSNDKQYINLDNEIKENFLIALFLHDLGRAKQRTPYDYKTIRFEHGVAGAKTAFDEFKLSSLFVLIPIILHDKTNNDFLFAKDNILKENNLFIDMPTVDKDFLFKIRKEYTLLSQNDKALMLLGINLVRDCDRIDILHNGISALNRSKKPRIGILSDKIKSDFYAKELLNLSDYKTVVDRAFLLMGFLNDFHTDYGKSLIFDGNYLEDMRDHTLSELLEDKSNNEIIQKEFNEAIHFLKSQCN